MKRPDTRRLALIVAWTMVLGACASAPQAPPVREAPIERDTPTRDDSAALPTTNPATRTLLAAADEAARENNHTDAISYLERAIRLDPRNSSLWVALSAQHLARGELAAARQHCRKAIALAGNDELAARNAWLQLADIEDAAGNADDAASLRRRYRSLRG